MIFQYNKNLIIKLILIILLQNLKFGITEFYTSIHEMTRLVELEGTFLQQIKNFVKKNEDKLDYLKARLNDFEREHEEALSAGPAYLDMPINQYLLTKRLTVDWERIKNLMEYKTAEKSLKKLWDKYNQTGVSYEEELNGGITGILRLQEVYRLKTKDIAAGILQGIQYDKELDSHLCFDIGVYGIQLKQFRMAHSWLMEALRRLPFDKNKLHIGEPLEVAHILTALADVKTKLGDIKGANATYLELLDLKPESNVLPRLYMTFILEHGNKNSTEIDYNEDHAPLPTNLLRTETPERWRLTCSGHIKKTPRQERYLRCGYLTETHPFLQLAPIKVEELNHDPLLVQYYDVLSDNEIEELKNIANHRVKRATVVGVNGSIISPARTSQFLFVAKEKHKVLQIIDQRVEDMTNLNMDFAEEHQFQNYGIGGHYGPHPDYFNKDFLEKRKNRTNWKNLGDRIATVLFYLSDVEQGGGTAFPFLKSLLMPKKGAAAFWYNLHASGDVDTRTIHGGCPIVVGSKWVLNRWLRERNQDQKRPCELYNDARPKPK